MPWYSRSVEVICDTVFLKCTFARVSIVSAYCKNLDGVSVAAEELLMAVSTISPGLNLLFVAPVFTTTPTSSRPDMHGSSGRPKLKALVPTRQAIAGAIQKELRILTVLSNQWDSVRSPWYVGALHFPT